MCLQMTEQVCKSIDLLIMYVSVRRNCVHKICEGCLYIQYSVNISVSRGLSTARHYGTNPSNVSVSDIAFVRLVIE